MSTARRPPPGNARSNLMPGASDDGDAATHGRDTAVYQDLIAIRVKYDAWLASNIRFSQFYNDEMKTKAMAVSDAISDLADDLDQPL